MSAARRRTQGGRSGLSTLEWIAVAVIVAGGAYLGLAPSPGVRAGAVDMLAAMSVERESNGREVARVDGNRLRGACERVGLPDPPDLDGGDPVPVRIVLERLQRWTHSRDPEELARVGQIYQALEEHRAALECFAALVQLLPQDPRWHYLVGAEAQAMGLDEVAVASLERARGLEPDYPTTHLRLGLAYLERNELEQAEQNYERYRQLLPGQSQGYLGLGRVALERGDAPGAEQALRRALAATSNDYMAYRYLSRALALQGKHDEARRASETAEGLPHYQGWLVFDERLKAAHALANTQRYLENQMRLAQGTGDTATLAGVAEQLAARRPDDYNTLGILAGAYVGLGRLDDATRTIERVLTLKPDAIAMLNLRAQIALRSRDYPTAYRAIDSALAVDPDFAPIHDTRARVLALEQRYAEAEEELRLAIRLDPAADRSRLLLAFLHEQSGRRTDAAALLREILKRDPSNAEAKRRLQQLQQ